MMSELLLFVAIGFVAQMVDGAIGMAYGITATTLLLSMGVSPATASASVHTAEVFTTGASGIAHWRLGNVDRKAVARLALPGMLGGGTGAYVLVTVPGEVIRPLVSAYLLTMGVVILWRALRSGGHRSDPPRRLGVLGLCGGFLDAVGGGGWGAIVSTTLIGRGVKPRYAIGTANVAEFFVTATVTATFVATIGLSLWPVIVGLVIGGVVAAPFSAYAARHLPDQTMMILVAVVVILLSVRGIASVL